MENPAVDSYTCDSSVISTTDKFKYEITWAAKKWNFSARVWHTESTYASVLQET